MLTTGRFQIQLAAFAFLWLWVSVLPNSVFSQETTRNYAAFVSHSLSENSVFIAEAGISFKPVSPQQERRLTRDFSFSARHALLHSEENNEAVRDTVPNPRDVMMRSVILPGWGQYTNRQIWKIPLVYGLIGGIGAYAWYADTRYRGFRAAFYNSFPENDDFRFGETPDWISPDSSTEFLRDSRNFFRNRRDFLILATVLAYGLNIIDAYVFAHMRDFDVSDDLSSRRVNVQSSTFLTSHSLPVPLVSFNFRF